MVIKRPQNATERLILALDVDTLEEAKQLVVELKDYVGYFKVGLQLYTACGYDSVRMIHDLGAKVFFDAKFHDIPNTVARASANLVKNDVDFFDLHIKGGSKMLSTTCRLWREVAKKYEKPTPTILGVTLLSSFGQKTLNQELNVNMNIDEYVSRLAKVALDAKLDGVVASASEVGAIRPTDAIEAGVDYMVVGRPIISAKNRIEAVTLILDEIEEAKETIKERIWYEN